MTVTSDTALLVLDVQNDLVDPKGKVGAGGLAKIVADRNVLANLKGLIAAFRGKGAHVVYAGLGYREDYLDVLSVAPRIAKARENKVAVLGTWGSEFHSDVAPQAGDMVFRKQCVNPFFGTALLEWLRRQGVTNLVLAGTVDSVVEQILAFRDQVGDFGQLLYACHDWMDPVLGKRSMELFATEVMPRVNGALGQ